MLTTLVVVRRAIEESNVPANVVELADFIVMEMRIADRGKWANYIWSDKLSSEVRDRVVNSQVETVWNNARGNLVMLIPKRKDER